ncbi:MAG: hypothetical protein ACP5M7_10440, partial [Thermoproteota archaeon]
LSGEQLADAIPKIRNIRYYEFSNMYVEKKGEVYLRQVIGEGRYFVRATTEDGKAYEWVVETKGSDYVRVPSRYSELEGKNLEKLQLISY